MLRMLVSVETTLPKIRVFAQVLHSGRMCAHEVLGNPNWQHYTSMTARGRPHQTVVSLAERWLHLF